MTANEAQIIVDRLRLITASVPHVSPHEVAAQIERLVMDVAKMSKEEEAGG